MASLSNIPVGIYAPITEERRFIRKMVEQYSEKSYINNGPLLLEVRDRETRRGLFASDFTVSVLGDSIDFGDRAAIAACAVNLFAKEKITLGAAKKEEMSHPFRLYAPHMLTITAEELQLGNMEILAPLSRMAMISCRKITVLESYREESLVLEVVKQWLAKPDTPIEVQEAST